MTAETWQPWIQEDEEFKSLQFNELDIQSRMRKSAPDELVLSYTQAMMAFMLFVDAPREVLIVGLGGGALSKFCYRYLPASRITTLEICQDVINLRNEFLIPQDQERFQVIHGDIVDYLDGKAAIADVILLDGYDPVGLPDGLNSAEFYQRCNAALTSNGILVANISLGAVRDSSRSRLAVERAVGRAVSIRSTAGHNDIVLGFRATEFPAVKALKARAVSLREKTGVDFPLLLDKLRSGLAAG